MSPLDGKWRVAMFRQPQPKPFDHKFQVTSPDGRQWVARSLQAALRLVDAQCYLSAHPELGLVSDA